MHVCPESQIDVLVSSGPGCKIEIMNAVFKHFFEDWEYKFCRQLIDDYTTLSIVEDNSAMFITLEKCQALQVFGAITGLALVYGHYPGKLCPLFLIYLLNNCNFKCLEQDLVFAYFPDLADALDHWLSTGPMDSVASFAMELGLYLNLPVSILCMGS
ncbi:hypothetical protein GYMLUDRAFT_59417 [Collybiopsis luxurians FD-317 M1]|uniref:Uncharacterized protein n=1 Tax=Collybiopsis luxurians FD-317 M1 TaxID=944289 RepID=A0A0D0BAH6_9AGAR|nr:hypothetical protein GYMLUDRAFT_59417 [Collybiopsis luxurians FD-317 M1]